MTNLQQYRNELLTFLQDIATKGYTSFITPENSSYVYAHIVTPNDNVLYVHRNSFKWRGWDIGFSYRPTKKHGSGVGCFEALDILNVDFLQRAENYGLTFVSNRNIKWESSLEFFEHNAKFKIPMDKIGIFASDLHRKNEIDKIESMEKLQREIERKSKNGLVGAYITNGYNGYDCIAMLANSKDYENETGYVLYDLCNNKAVFIKDVDVNE